MLKPGEVAPEFAVKDDRGRTVRLSDFKGQKEVLLWFYPKADTPGCTKEGCGFRDLNQELAGKGVQVLGVSFDETGENRRFSEKFQFNFPLLSDPERKLGVAYGAADDAQARSARRISYLIGKDGRVRKAWDKVEAAAHPAQVLAEL
jgi:peroxiredoxin Q/BCP